MGDSVRGPACVGPPSRVGLAPVGRARCDPPAEGTALGEGGDVSAHTISTPWRPTRDGCLVSARHVGPLSRPPHSPQ